MEHLKKIAVLICLLFSISAYADDVSLQWDANTESYLSGYKIYWGTASAAYDQSIDVGKVTETTVVNVYTDQRIYFAATAYSSQSDWMSYCVSDPGWIESYPDAAERQTACTGHFDANSDEDIMESGFSNEVSYDGPIIVLKTSRPDQLDVLIPGIRATQALEVFYKFEGAGSVIEDISTGDAALNLNIESGTVGRITNGGIQIVESSIIRSAVPASELIARSKQSNELTVEIWINPLLLTQSGPARMVTLSSNISSRNFTVGQENNAIAFRVRRDASTSNGLPQLQSAAGTLEDKLTHIVCTYGSGTARIYKNGVEISASNFGGSLADWDESMHIGLGNEMTGDRTWLGAIYLVAVYSRELSVNEIINNYAAGF